MREAFWSNSCWNFIKTHPTLVKKKERSAPLPSHATPLPIFVDSCLEWNRKQLLGRGLRRPSTRFQLAGCIRTRTLQNLTRSRCLYSQSIKNETSWLSHRLRWSSTRCCASVRKTRGAGAAGGVTGGDARDASDATPADDDRPYGTGGLPTIMSLLTYLCMKMEKACN